MKSARQIETERQKKADELIAVNAEVQRATARLAELKAGEGRFLKWKATEEANLRASQAQLEQDRAELHAAIDRTHLKMSVSVDELADQAARQTERLDKLKTAIPEAKAVLDDVLHQIDVQRRDLTKLDAKKASLIADLASLEKEWVSVQQDLTAARSDLSEVRRQLEAEQDRLNTLPRKESELKLKELRIRKYYERAGLRFVE